jgi:hypothetical protein
MPPPPSRTRLILVGGMVSIAAIAPSLTDSASATRHHEPRSSSALALRWFDLTSQTVAAAGFPEQSTQGRTWAVSWLAAARAVTHRGGHKFTQAAFATALHDALVTQVPSQISQLDAALDSSLAEIPDGNAKKHGIKTGHREAAKALAERAGDGLDTASVMPHGRPLHPGPASTSRRRRSRRRLPRSCAPASARHAASCSREMTSSARLPRPHSTRTRI